MNWANCEPRGEGAKGLIQGSVGKHWESPRQSGNHKHRLLHPQCIPLLHSPMGRCSGCFRGHRGTQPDGGRERTAPSTMWQECCSTPELIFFSSFLGILWHFHKRMAQLFRVGALSPRRKGTLWQTGTLWDLATCSLGPKCVFAVTLSSNSDCTSYPFFN